MALDVVLDRATAADSPAIRTVLSRAYRTNPLMAWVLPDEATREDACAAWLGPSVDRYLAVGRVHVARLRGQVVGAAAWRLPDADPPPESLPTPAWALAALVGRDRAAEVLAALASAAPLAPAVPTPYLNFLAVEPSGEVGTSLATTDPRNLPFYVRLGYLAVGSVRLGGDGPVLTVLQRAPRTT